MSCYYGGDSPDLVDGAKQILHILMTVYPGHNVKVYGYASGVFHIKHLDFEQVGGGWGMALKGRQFFSASHMQSEVVRKFGEWLERAHRRRGRATGEDPTSVEGVPLRFQPVEFQNEQREKKLEEQISKAIAEGAIRTEARPQVAKEMETNG